MATAVLAGALGGAAGGLIALFVAWRIGRRPAWLIMIPVFASSLAVSLAHSGRPARGADFADRFADDPSIQAMRDHYPADYGELRAKLNSLPPNATQQDAWRIAQSAMTDLLRRQKLLADRENARAFLAISVEEDRAIAAVDPGACLDYFAGRPTKLNLATALSPDLRAREVKVTARLLTQTALHPVQPAPQATFEQIKALGIQAMPSLSEAEQTIVINLLKAERDPASRAEQAAMCDFQIAEAQAALSQPPQSSGDLIRSLLR